MPDWLDKAKEAAKNAAEEAKKLAEAAKNADYGSMLDKTKNMAMHAADEAKKAADNVLKKDTPETKPDVIPQQDNPQSVQPVAPVTMPATPTTSTSTVTPAPAAGVNKTELLAKIAQVEHLLQEIKVLLK